MSTVLNSDVLEAHPISIVSVGANDTNPHASSTVSGKGISLVGLSSTLLATVWATLTVRLGAFCSCEIFVDGAAGLTAHVAELAMRPKVPIVATRMMCRR